MALNLVDTIRAPNRLAALRRLAILDTPPEEPFDRLTRLAAQVLHAPIALLSLVDEDRQFFKSTVGLAEPWASLRQTPLSHSFCQLTVALREPLIISNASEHPLLHDSLAISDLGVLAYAGIPLLLPDGQAIGAFCVIDRAPRSWRSEEITILKDLAASVVTELELRRQLLQMQHAHSEKLALLQSTAQGIFGIDLHGLCTFINATGAAMLGYAPEELQGQPIHALIHPQCEQPGLDMPACAMLQVLYTGVGTRSDHELIRRSDGTSFAAAFACHPVCEEEQIKGLVVTFDDVSERMRQEQMQRFLAEAGIVLASALDYQTTLQRVTRLAVPMLADLCTVHILTEDGLIQRVALAHHDAEREALLSSYLQRYAPRPDGAFGVARALRTGQPEFLAEVSDHMLQALAQNEHHLEALRSCKPVSLIAVPLIARERTIGAISLVMAESGRRYRQEDLAVAEELARRAAIAVDNARLYSEAQHALQMREEFLSIAAHELKTPITTLLGYAQLLQRRAKRDGRGSERDLRALRVLTEQAQRLHRLSASLLDLSRLQRGRLIIERQPVDLVALAEQVVDELQPAFDHHLVDFYGPEVPLVVQGDELRLAQVLGILLQNAVRYSPEGGLVTLRVEQQGEFACLEVSDQGMGIPSDALPQLFNRFYRADNAAAQNIGGLGLGLHIAKEILTLHGGTVEVRSTEGHGSTFTIRLPLSAAT